jgi:hypothetical protein
MSGCSFCSRCQVNENRVVESITLVIAIIAGALVLTLRYDRAFAAYVASMLFYPSYCCDIVTTALSCG